MTGYDVTQEELDHARVFVNMADKGGLEVFTMRRDQLVRLMAWYGSIRAKGGDGPGKLIINGEPSILGECTNQAQTIPASL